MSLHKLFAILSSGLAAAAVAFPVAAIPLGIASAAAGGASAVFAHNADKTAAVTAAIAGAAVNAAKALPGDHPAAGILNAVISAANQPDDAGNGA